MTARGVALAPADFGRLAALHVSCLPGSMLSRFGTGYMAEAYRYFARSPSERLLACRQDGTIVSACVLSLSPATMTQRLALNTGLALQLVRHAFDRQVLAAVLDFSPGVEFGCPEMVFIYTDPSSRGSGHGAILLAQCEALLREERETRYAIKTLDDEGNRAIRFYLAHGFTERGRFIRNGTRFRWMDKTL